MWINNEQCNFALFGGNDYWERLTLGVLGFGGLNNLVNNAANYFFGAGPDSSIITPFYGICSVYKKTGVSSIYESSAVYHVTYRY